MKEYYENEYDKKYKIKTVEKETEIIKSYILEKKRIDTINGKEIRCEYLRIHIDDKGNRYREQYLEGNESWTLVLRPVEEEDTWEDTEEEDTGQVEIIFDTKGPMLYLVEINILKIEGIGDFKIKEEQIKEGIWDEYYHLLYSNRVYRVKCKYKHADNNLSCEFYELKEI